jgi:competence ComEA-like helix-hairpin-helix protein
VTARITGEAVTMSAVNINTATAAELQEVPGLGAALADAIVKRRESVGPFRSVAELTEIDGISSRLLARIGHLLTVGEDVPSTVQILLRPSDDRAGSDYTGHSVDIRGSHRTAASPDAVPFAAASATSSAGAATLSIPKRKAIIDRVEIRALAPDGAVLTTRVELGASLPQQITLTIDPRQYGTTQPNADPTAGLPTRIRGQVIDSGGRQIGAGIQVVLWGATAANPADADFRALVVTSTDTRGHCSGPYPAGQFTAAHAGIAIAEEEFTVPIHLADQAFPESVILVVDLPDSLTDEDCGCAEKPTAPRSPDATDLGRADGTFSSDAGAGRCVDFTKPDRTLEEYAFSYVVRTTEPAIKGLTIDEPRKVPGSVVAEFIPAVLDREVAREVRTEAFNTAAPAAGRAVEASIDAGLLRTLSRNSESLTVDAVASAAKRSLHGDLIRYLGRQVARTSGRQPLTGTNPIDWDDDPTVYQAATIAHGHLLRFKQEWVADGYSMGNLLYSLPLAPGQKKQLAVVDWERRETTARREARESREALQAELERDRDVSEIVSATLRESTRGGSSSSTGSIGGGLGIGFIAAPVAGLLGIGGGFASANSEAWQKSSRSTSANALNQLRDRTVQSASAVRSQRTSVVHTVAQGERVTASTESVANYNHCHAITIQYFEVLRHLLVRQRLADVQECLLVPLLMSWFTDDKALRWRNTLASAVPRTVRGGFAALDRIDANYAGSDLPTGRYADETLESVEGELTLRFQLTRPKDDSDGKLHAPAWSGMQKLFAFSPEDFYNQYLKGQSLKEKIFLEQLGPKIASSVVSLLKVEAVKTDESRVDLAIDPTLLSTFVNDRALSVTLRMSGSLDPVQRSEIKAVVISSKLQLPLLPFIIDVLPTGSRVIVEGGSLRYRTGHASGALFRNARIRNDLTGTDDVRIETPLSRAELRNPRQEDRERARTLLDHLNEHIERYHHVIWSRMSDDRRYMLLDGFEAPNAGGRSVASVVENELIGIVGNCMVLPVARGFHLDPTFNQDDENPVDLLEHYEPNTPIDPTRVAIPTRGVYAEAVMGACNSCETIDETRYWRWSEEPIPDSPASILPVSTETRRAEPADVTPTELPPPIIAMQSAPAAPDPTGLAAALGLLGQAGVFKDITGLEGTQKNAAAALQQAMETATTFGTKAADLALQAKLGKDIDKAMKQIEQAKAKGLIDDKQAAGLTETALRGLIGAGTTNPKQSATTADVEKITKAAGKEKASVSVTKPTGEKVEVNARRTGKDETAPRPSIDLAAATSSADLRAFRPASGDKSLIVELEAALTDAPGGSSVRWSCGTAGAVTFDTPTAARTRARGVTPGVHDVTLELLDSGGTVVASKTVKMSVPQCVRVVKDAAFDQMLTDAQLSGNEVEVVAEMRRVVEHLLGNANARVFWELGGISEAVPAHVPAGNVIVATVKDKDPTNKGLLGVTTGPSVGDSFDETIELYPGMYAEPNAIDVDTETQALIIQLESSVSADPALTPLTAQVFGRLIGETLSHEIGHALLWDDIPGSGHNSPAIANDLMNRGVDRLFGQRTGMENTAQVSPVEPEHYVDHGLSAIGGFQAVNQGLIDRQWPVPPAFG